MTDSDPSDSSTYHQRPCPNCGQQETHMPFEYTETMVCTCGECGYTFVKVPNEKPDNTLNAVPIEELEALVEDWRAKAFENGSDLYAEGISESAQELQEILGDYE